MKVHRISIGPGEIAGYFSKLKAGFDALGIKSEHFVLSANKFDFEESNYFLRTPFIHAEKLRRSRNMIIHMLGKALAFIIRIIVFIYSFVRCDVFIFSGFNSFLWFHELPLLKFFGKRVLVVYLGSDARPPIFSARHLDDAGGFVSPRQTHCEAVLMKRKIEQVEKYADVIINHTATSQYFSKPFVRINALGMPTTDVAKYADCTALPRDGKIHILHAPSRPLAKGSLHFRQIIGELRDEGYPINYVELTGVPNSAVLKELQQCDLVLDELYSDVPMAMFATEAGMFGKPVVVGGYYADQYRIDNPDATPPPSLYIHPDKIKDEIKKLIDDVEYRVALGSQAKQFVHDQWSEKKVAENYLRLINGSYPESWMCFPSSLSYFWGWGLSKENWLKQVSEYVALMGDQALLLDTNPKLKKMVLAELQRSQIELVA